jgi:hypothetical protein
MKQEFLQIRITEDEKSELNDLITKIPNQDMTVSQFVRDAIREKVTRLKRKLETEAAAASA